LEWKGRELIAWVGALKRLFFFLFFFSFCFFVMKKETKKESFETVRGAVTFSCLTFPNGK
jgi:hypothetical protein